MKRNKVWGLIIVCLLLAPVMLTRAQSDMRLRLSAFDLSAFPTVRFTILSTSAISAPLDAADFEQLRLRENGVPISDFELRYVPVGIDAIFIIDADAPMAVVNESSGESRLQTVQQSIERYATRFMSPTELDRVSIVVPGRGNRGATFLVEDERNPGAVINAIQSYDPALPEEIPVQTLLEEGIAHAAAIREPGRFQAIFFFSEARRLAEFVDFPQVTAAAQDIELPLYVAIVGAGASVDEINNALQLTGPTRAFYTPLPNAAESDDVFLLWQRQGNQPEVVYESVQRNSGRYPVTINIGNAGGSRDLVLELTPPEVTIALESNVLRRAGTAVDTPLADLQPVSIELPVQISWPDGLPRPLETIVFTVNGQPQPLITVPQPDEKSVLQLPWDVRRLDTGPVSLQVTVSDELGYEAVSDNFILTVAVARPTPPTPTPVPTATPTPFEQVGGQVLQTDRTLLLQLLAGVGLTGIALFLLRWWREHRRRTAAARQLAERRAALQAVVADDTREAEPAVVPQAGLLQLLEPLPEATLPRRLELENVTIGRDPIVVDIALPERSVAPLHARIKWGNGRYWLTDEGSASGTLLNHERLGLSPRSLADGDIIRLGRIGLRFTLHPLEEDEEAAETVNERETIEESPAEMPADEDEGEVDADSGDTI